MKRAKKLYRRRTNVAPRTPKRIGVARGLFEVPDCIDPHNDDVLAAFDPKRHGGEVMVLAPRGREVV